MLPCSAIEHLRFMAKGVCTLKSASSHSCAEVLLLSRHHVAKVTLTKRSIETKHHNGMSWHKIWNTRCSRRMQREVILLEGKRPIDLRCQCMQQAKIDTTHDIQSNRQDGKVQSAHTDLTSIEHNKCNERSKIRYHKYSKKCKMQSQHSEFHGQNLQLDMT